MPEAYQGQQKGDVMTAISMVSMGSVATKADDHSRKTIALFCLVGLAVSFGLMSLGVNLGAGWA